MANKNLNFTLTVFLIGFVTFTAFLSFEKHSRDYSKENILFGAAKLASHEAISKAYPGSLQVTVHGDNQRFSPGAPLTLTVTVTSDKDLSNVHLKWALPHGLTVLHGLQDEDVSLQSSQTITRQLTVVGAENKNYQIHVSAYYSQNGTNMGAFAQYNSKPEDLPEIHRKAIMSAKTIDQLQNPTNENATGLPVPPKILQ